VWKAAHWLQGKEKVYQVCKGELRHRQPDFNKRISTFKRITLQTAATKLRSYI